MEGYLDKRYSCQLDVSSYGTTEVTTYKPTSTTTATQGDQKCDCDFIDNAQCADRQCQCIEGFLPVYDPDHPSKLVWCKDPIVLTSTIGGYCLVQKHCSSLMGSLCVDQNPGEGGTFKRCECEDGLKPALPDPNTGVIKRCIGPNEEGVLSLISQAMFGDDTADETGVPSLKVNLKLTEKVLLETCQSLVSGSL